MVRTQIYLTKEEARALGKRSKETGLTRSQLIRDAIDRAYLIAPSRKRDDLLQALREAAGAWKGRRETGAEYVDRIRHGKRPTRNARSS